MTEQMVRRIADFMMQNALEIIEGLKNLSDNEIVRDYQLLSLLTNTVIKAKELWATTSMEAGGIDLSKGIPITRNTVKK